MQNDKYSHFLTITEQKKELTLLGAENRNIFDDIEQFKNKNYKVKFSTVNEKSLKDFLDANR